MADLTAQTTFQIQEPADEYEETLDLVLLPANEGIDSLRETALSALMPCRR